MLYLPEGILFFHLPKKIKGAIPSAGADVKASPRIG